MIRPNRHAWLLRGFARDTRGAVSVLAAFLAVLGISLSVLVVDAGHLYLAKRRLQAAVDAAALAAAGNTAQAATLVANSLAANGYDTDATVETGSYSADPALAQGTRFDPGAATANAVRVTKTVTTPGFLAGIFGDGDGSSVKASATATRIPAVAFSAGTGLGSLSGGQVNQLLGGLFGTTLSLSLVNYSALATSNVDALTFLDQLAAQAGVTAGTYGDLANTSVTLDQMIAAATAALNIQGGSNAAALDALNLLSLQLPAGASATLGQVVNLALWQMRQIGSIVQQDSGQTRLNLFDIVSAAARAYGAGHIVTLGSAIALPVTGTTTTADLVAGSPMASVGLSPKGTSIATSQVRMRFNVTIASISLGGATVQIGLPVYLQIAAGTATATDIPCVRGGTRATITAAAQAGSAWIGSVGNSDFTNFAADPPVTQGTVASTTLLGVTIAFKGSGNIPILASAATPLDFTQDQIDAGTPQSVAGSDSGKVFSTLAAGMTVTPAFSAGALTGTINSLLAPVTPLVKSTLVTLLTALDPATDTLLRALGLRLGEIDVIVRGVNCGVPTLVH